MTKRDEQIVFLLAPIQFALSPLNLVLWINIMLLRGALHKLLVQTALVRLVIVNLLVYNFEFFGLVFVGVVAVVARLNLRVFLFSSSFPLVCCWLLQLL